MPCRTITHDLAHVAGDGDDLDGRVGADATAGALHRRRRAAIRARWPILDARRADGRRNRETARGSRCQPSEVLRALLVQHAMAEAAGAIPAGAYAEVSQRDGARYDSRHGFDADPLASLLSDPRLAGIARRLVPALVRVLGPDAPRCVAPGPDRCNRVRLGCARRRRRRAALAHRRPRVRRHRRGHPIYPARRLHRREWSDAILARLAGELGAAG